jgi:hypothetical protein
MAHRRWRDPELRATVKLAVMTLGYLVVMGLGWLLWWLYA